MPRPVVWITTRLPAVAARGGRWLLYPVLAVTALAAVGGDRCRQFIDQHIRRSPARQSRSTATVR